MGQGQEGVILETRVFSSTGILLATAAQLTGVGLRVFKHIPLDWVEDFWRRGKGRWEKALMGKMSVEVYGGGQRMPPVWGQSSFYNMSPLGFSQRQAP